MGTDAEDTVVRPRQPPTLVEPPPAAGPASAGPAPATPIDEDVAPTGPPRVRLADGTDVSLGTPVYLGRKPSVPRAHAGTPVQLIVVPSPSREVSATHVELRVVGGAVVASDMRSTNGTIVAVPGSAPRMLIRGESAVVPRGSIVDLGDGNRLAILGPA